MDLSALFLICCFSLSVLTTVDAAPWRNEAEADVLERRGCGFDFEKGKVVCVFNKRNLAEKAEADVLERRGCGFENGKVVCVFNKRNLAEKIEEERPTLHQRRQPGTLFQRKRSDMRDEAEADVLERRGCGFENGKVVCVFNKRNLAEKIKEERPTLHQRRQPGTLFQRKHSDMRDEKIVCNDNNRNEAKKIEEELPTLHQRWQPGTLFQREHFDLRDGPRDDALNQRGCKFSLKKGKIVCSIKRDFEERRAM